MSGPKLNIKDLPPAMQEAVRRQAAESGMISTSHAARAKHEFKAGEWDGKEKDLQHQVEAWLDLIGFAKRNKKSIVATDGRGGRNGWQIHVARTIGNPFLLDILLLGADGRWLEIELKNAKGRLSELQALLTTDDKVCRSLADVQRTVLPWLEGL